MNITAIEAMLADKRSIWSTPMGDLINYIEDLVDEVNEQRALLAADLEKRERLVATKEECIKTLKVIIESYEQILDKAYDDFQKSADNWELREILKELIEYAPRKNWEEK